MLVGFKKPPPTKRISEMLSHFCKSGHFGGLDHHLMIMFAFEEGREGAAGGQEVGPSLRSGVLKPPG